MSFLKVEVGIRGFKLFTDNSSFCNNLERYASTLVQQKIERQQGRVVEVEGDRFYVSNENKNTFYFLNSHYATIMEMIDKFKRSDGRNDLDVATVTLTEEDGSDVSFSDHTLNLIEPPGSKFEFQNEIVEEASSEGHKHHILEVQTGRGKMQPLSSLIRIPGGWTTMGAIKVGDVITAVDGGTTTVTDIHPHGVKEVFRVTFEDGRSTLAGGEHLWSVMHSDWPGVGKVIDTNELIELLNESQSEQYFIPLAESEQIEDTSLSIPPEILGAMLEDVLIAPNPWSMRIPKYYLNASHAQRSALLKGLLGRTVNEEVVTFYTRSQMLSNDVAYLVRSLGGIAESVKCPDAASCDVAYPRYRVRMHMPKVKQLRITSIEKTSDEPCQCISVDHHTHLYITDDFIVTHNTAMAMKSIVNIGKRTLILTKPGYIDKWTGDLTNPDYSLSLRPGELIRVGGSKGSSSNKMDEMDAIMEMGRTGELDNNRGRTCKVMLISSKTFDLWIKRELESDSKPAFEEFMKVTGCGYLVYDESHEWFRMNYWTFMLLNPARVLDLSATLIPGDDAFIKERYDERFPKEKRYNKLEYNKYIDAMGIYYHVTDSKITDRVNRMKLYNHIEFEKLIMKSAMKQVAYFDMVTGLLKMFYKGDKWEKGQRALVFFGSREMCTRYTEHVKGVFPDLDVKRNIQGDNYDDFVNADIGVSTPGKSGTAVDIPGLVLSIVTVVLAKEDKNIQILGRTREVKDWDITPKAIFLHCQQLTKHLIYLKRRGTMFRNRVKSFKILSSRFIIK